MINKNLSAYLPIIKQHFPYIRSETVRSLTDGEAHDVFLVQDTVFRFPRNEFIIRKDQTEEKFLRQFAKLSPVAVPQVQGHRDTRSGSPYQTYPYIPGAPLTEDRAAQLSESTLRSIAAAVGKFLAVLHSFPLEEAEKLKIESVADSKHYGAYFKEILKVDKPLLYPFLTSSEWDWIEANCIAFYTDTQKSFFPLAVTHADVVPNHILVDEKTQTLSGILDFSLRISDPSQDFQYFDRYGDLFLKTAYENYLPTDAYFEERRKFHARDFPVAYAYLALTSETKKPYKDRYLKELKDYIAAHPLSELKK